MAAGQGFKTFATGDVLTASDVNGYLMQGVLVFASAAARNSAITSPQQGQMAFLKDTNTTTYYTGSAWANLDTTGMVNPMTTTGDTIYSSSGSTPARLGIGSTGQVLTVAGGVPTWATAAAGGKVLQVVQGTTSTLTTITSNSFTDTGLTATITPTLATSKVLVILNQNVIIDQSSGQTNLQLGSFIKLFRGATAIWGSTGGSQHVYFYIGGNSAAKSVGGNMAIAYLDSPATTSATIYKTQIAVDGSTTYNTVSCQPGSASSSIILMEIGA
jgi:hypothetical protein